MNESIGVKAAVCSIGTLNIANNVDTVATNVNIVKRIIVFRNTNHFYSF